MAIKGGGDFDVPSCPSCKKDSMIHKCFSHIAKGSDFMKNGWYCESCNAGPFQLGHVTEAEVVRFAIRLIN